MDDVLVNKRKHSLESLSKERKTKQNVTNYQKNSQTQSQTTFVTCLLLCLFVYVPFLYCLVVPLFVICFFCVFFFSRVLISYTVYLVVVVHFNCIKRPAFKVPEFLCLQSKKKSLSLSTGHLFAAHGWFSLLFLPVLTSRHPEM